jgi:hypothetical protein
MVMRKIIRTDGTEQLLERPHTMTQLKRLIGCDTLDSVTLHHMGEPLHVMLLDDNGYETQKIDHRDGRFELRPVRARKPVNVAATALYHANCRPGTTHQIVGDVAIVPDDDFA